MPFLPFVVLRGREGQPQTLGVGDRCGNLEEDVAGYGLTESVVGAIGFDEKSSHRLRLLWIIV